MGIRNLKSEILNNLYIISKNGLKNKCLSYLNHRFTLICRIPLI
jgi:hypothetical protein